MNSDKQHYALPIMIIILLLSQVMLSTILVSRLNKLEQRVLAGLSNQEIQPEIPAFVSGISIDDDPQLGANDATITIIEFADFECPFCADANKNIDIIMSEYEGKILFVYRDFPLEHIHANAFQAAEAANCARDQDAYWEMHDSLFAHQTQLDIDNIKKYAIQLDLNIDQFNNCLSNHKYEDEIHKDMQDGIKYQVSGTPTFFINGHRVVGGSLEQLRGTIDLLLDK